MVENYELEHLIQKQKRLYDEQCKKILSFKPILAYLFQCCLEECKDMSLEEIQDLLDEEQPHEKMISRNVEDQSVAGSMVRYDLLYKVRNPLNNQFLWINIEPQGMDPGAYELFHRAFYYGARMVGRQRNDPEGFREDDFDNIQKIITLWICLQHAKYKNDTINKYVLEEKCILGQLKHSKDFYDLIEIQVMYPRQYQ